MLSLLLILHAFAGLFFFVYCAYRVASESDRQGERIYQEYLNNRQVTDE